MNTNKHILPLFYLMQQVYYDMEIKAIAPILQVLSVNNNDVLLPKVSYNSCYKASMITSTMYNGTVLV